MSGKLLYKEIGGFRKGQSFWASMYGTWPFGKLEIWDDEVVLFCLWEKLQFQKNEINLIEIQKGVFFSAGIRIHHNQSNTSPFVVFWTFSAESLINKFKSLGYSVKS